MQDWRTAPVNEKLRAMLGFLEKLTLIPDEVSKADTEALQNMGIAETAIEQAIYICAMFNIIDRIADALHFSVPSADIFAQRAQGTLQRGYSMASMKP